MGKRWVMVRIERSVHDQLVALRDSLERARIGGQVHIPEADGPLSLSEIVARLVKHVKNDRRRMREAAARRRARRRDPVLVDQVG